MSWATDRLEEYLREREREAFSDAIDQLSWGIEHLMQCDGTDRSCAGTTEDCRPNLGDDCEACATPCEECQSIRQGKESLHGNVPPLPSLLEEIEIREERLAS